VGGAINALCSAVGLNKMDVVHRQLQWNVAPYQSSSSDGLFLMMLARACAPSFPTPLPTRLHVTEPDEVFDRKTSRSLSTQMFKYANFVLYYYLICIYLYYYVFDLKSIYQLYNV